MRSIVKLVVVVLALLLLPAQAFAYGGGSWANWARRPWNPKDVGTLSIWYRADVGVTLNSTTVSSWANQAGTANAATQGTAGQQPLFNAASAGVRPSMTFDGSNDVLVLASNVTIGAATIFIVGAQLSTLANYECLIETQKHFLSVRSPGVNQYMVNYGADGLSGVPIGTTTAVLEASVRNFNDIDLAVNGAQVTVTNGTTYASNANTLIGAGSTAGTTQPTNLKLFEILVYQGNLSTADRLRVRKYEGFENSIPVN